MYNTKKRKLAILFSIIFLVINSSCTKDEIENNIVDKKLMKFNVSISSQTKADVINNDNFTSFKIYSYLINGNYDGTQTLGDAYMNGVDVSRELGYNSWITATDYYWPYDTNNKMQIFASSEPLDMKLSDGSYPAFPYTVEDINSQKDLIVSSLFNQNSLSNDGKIALKFKHVLSQINFSVKGEEEGYTYDITKIELKNVNSLGKFQFDNTENVGQWSAQTDPVDYVLNLNNFSSNGTDLTPVNVPLMLLPQENTPDVKVIVSYNVIRESDNYTFIESKEILLPSIDWGVGSKINYILNLSKGGIDDYNVVLSSDKPDLKYGCMMQINALITPEDSSAEIFWESSDPSILTVDQTGMARVIKNFVNKDAYITARYKNGIASIKIHVDFFPI